MDIVEKIERLKNKEEELLCILGYIEYIKNHMEKLTKEEELILSTFSQKSSFQLMSIRKRLDDIYEIINLANEL